MKLQGTTLGELYNPAMEITDQEEATDYFNQLVNYVVNNFSGYDIEKATGVVRSNIGYWAGYYDEETRQRVYSLYNTHHPFLGYI